MAIISICMGVICETAFALQKLPLLFFVLLFPGIKLGGGGGGGAMKLLWLNQSRIKKTSLKLKPFVNIPLVICYIEYIVNVFTS